MQGWISSTRPSGLRPGPAWEGEAGDGSDQIVQNLHENKNRADPGIAPVTFISLSMLWAGKWDRGGMERCTVLDVHRK